jgi:molybdopterin-guanine dinucleotide biosynthesis protein A
MQPKFLRWLVSTAARNDVSAVVPKADGRLQPLCALYRRNAVGACEALLSAGKYKIGGLFAQVPTHVVSEEELHAAGFGSSIFRNVNTREDYEQLLKQYPQPFTTSSRS